MEAYNVAMSTTSLSLLNRAAQDDAQSWNHLADLYQPLLQRWVAAFGIQPTDSEDLPGYLAAPLPTETGNRYQS